MAQHATTDRLLQRPLYVFDLPEELLYTLQLKNTGALEERFAQPDSQETQYVNGGRSSEASRTTTTTSCALCSLSFTSLQDQRSHVRSDLHAYNLKQKLRGRKPVDEAEFERLIGQLEESLSGSDSSESDESDEDEGSRKGTTLSALLKRQAKVTAGDAEDAPVQRRMRGSGQPPLLWFNSPKLPTNTSLGIYRAIFSNAEQEEEGHILDTIQRKQLAAKPPPNPQQQKVAAADDEGGGVPLPDHMIPKDIDGTSASGPHYFLCMIGGGHFAAMLVSLTPKLTKKAGIEDRAATVIAHKGFHRYTTRRKQGGSQSANDNSKGNAHSAGSSIRRYNETALIEEVRALLAEWKSWIDSSELLFVRASGSANRRTLFGPYEGQVLSVKDERLRGFPFNTRRATQSELMRAFVELTRVKVATIDEAAEARKAEEAAAAVAKAEAQANGKPSTPKPARKSKEDEAAELHTTQLQALIRRSKAPGMLSYIQSNGLSPDFRFFPAEQNHHTPTPLHLAAASNSPACVSTLLVKAGSDPAVQNGDGKTAFDNAGDRATRDAFRLARFHLGEAKWNWEAARVPEALSQAAVDERTARDRDEKAAEEKAEKDRRQAEIDRIRREDRQDGKHDAKYGKGHIVPTSMSAEERRMQDAKGMTDDMRLKLERERRARAAEERMRRMQGK